MKLLGLEASQNSYGGLGARGSSLDDAMRIATDLSGKIEVRLTDSR
jgi:hypothetical protein